MYNLEARGRKFCYMCFVPQEVILYVFCAPGPTVCFVLQEVPLYVFCAQEVILYFLPQLRKFTVRKVCVVPNKVKCPHVYNMHIVHPKVLCQCMYVFYATGSSIILCM